MGQLSLDLAPNSLRDIQFNSINLLRLERYIKSNNYPASLLFTGPPGTGKTSTAVNFIKTARCLNRKNGEVERCGKCKVCKSDLISGSMESEVLWIQRGKGTEVSNQLKQISEFTQTPPVPISEELQHLSRKFLVVDELDNLSDPQVSQLLVSAEHAYYLYENAITFIFITMKPNTTDDVTLNALDSRTYVFNFLPPTKAVIADTLQKFYPTIPRASLDLVAEASNHNFRKAINQLGLCFDDLLNKDKEFSRHDPQKLKTLTPDVVSDTLNYIDDFKRIELWKIIGNREYKKLREYLETILKNKFEEKRLIKQLIADIDYCIECSNTMTEGQYKVIELLTDYLNTPAPVDLYTFLKLVMYSPNFPVDINLLSKRHAINSGFDYS